MIPIPWRAVGLAGAILAAFVAGALWYKGGCDRRASALIQAQQAVVAAQQARNVKALQDQLAVNESIGAENAKLQAANTASDAHLRGLLRALAAKSGGSPLPGAPPGTGGTAPAADEPGCTAKLTGLVERTADLADAARSDATTINLLHQWANRSGLMN